MAGIAPDHSTKHATQPRAPVANPKAVLMQRAAAAARIVASLIASYRIIEPIHSREYAHLIDSHCCRSFIASATNCARLSKLSYSLARSTPVSYLYLTLSYSTVTCLSRFEFRFFRLPFFILLFFCFHNAIWLFYLVCRASFHFPLSLFLCFSSKKKSGSKRECVIAATNRFDLNASNLITDKEDFLKRNDILNLTSWI